ncbi:MAG: tetratricopeptide repeat protein, partial [Myxococcales bacterium]|nr:tetratricopeptide repeat protein [Polyangiaceae bacterium]MDW8249230.1 tetratricopeptide repeat protein [Myxococcales bacterium]
MFVHERIAYEAARRMGQLGIPLDFSPASLAGVDCYLGVLLPAGELPDIFDLELEDQLLLFGSYVGETFRKRLGGEWHDPGSDEDLPSRIQLVLPNGDSCFPLRLVHQSLLRLPPQGLRCLDALDQLRNRLVYGEDTPQEAPQWVRFANVLHGVGQYREAHLLLQRATTLDPTLVHAWLARADIEERLGALQNAIESLREAQRLLSPDHTILGEIQLRLTALLARLDTHLELIPELSTSPPQPPVPPLAEEDTLATSVFPQATDGGSLANNLIELARTGQVEFLDILLDETRSDWEL